MPLRVPFPDDGHSAELCALLPRAHVVVARLVSLVNATVAL